VDCVGSRGLASQTRYKARAHGRRGRYLWAGLAFSLACAACAGSAQPDATGTLTVESRAIEPPTPDLLLLPSATTSTKFAVIGDSGRGSTAQHEVAATMARYHRRFPFAFTLMLGDNIYEGPATADDYRRKFEEPYATLLERGVRFHAVLGNHDDPNQRFYPRFHMKGEPYYTFRPPGKLPLVGPGVRFFALNSTNLDDEQFAWLERELETSDSEWKIVFLHHPLYTGGRYRLRASALRWSLERLFIAYGVSVVFSGHEHFYQRTTLQRGVQYFVSGGAGSLRKGDARQTSAIARSFDADYHFMLVEIDGHELHFQAISRAGVTVDAGIIRRARPGRDTEDRRQSVAPSSQTPAPTPLAGAHP
jgi:hypothetical protein